MNIHKRHTVQRLRSGLPFITGGLLLVVAGYSLAVYKQPAALATGSSTCTPAGVFQSYSTGPAALTNADTERADAAIQWIKSMTNSKTNVVTSSTIEMVDYYSPTYKDDMYGTFNLRDRTYDESDGVYIGLEFRQYVVADMAYYLGSAPAYTDGTFMFNSSNNGRKLIQLVDTTTDEVLAEYIDKTGLVRSYSYEPGEQGYGTSIEDRTFSYDQALSLFVALGINDAPFAKLLVDGLLLMQTTTGQHTGGFIFSSPQMSPAEADLSYRTGSHAITTDALLAYIQKYPDDPDIQTYKNAALSALAFIDRAYTDDGPLEGLYKGGYGAYRGAQQEFDPTFVIEWASTEHNIDTWHTFMRAALVLDDSTYREKADQLAVAIMHKLYNTPESRLNQGVSVLEVDPADPLDANSWGAIQLSGAGSYSEASAALARVSRFENEKNGITGYAPFYSAGGYPGATETIWYEGTFGVALAHYRLGNAAMYRTVIDAAAAGQEPDGSFRYATTADLIYEIGQSRSIASTAWYVLATTARDAMWNLCAYTAPPAPETPITPSQPEVPSSPEHGSSDPLNTPPLAPRSQTKNPAKTSNRDIATDTPALPVLDATPSSSSSGAPPNNDTDDTPNAHSPHADEATQRSAPPAVVAGGAVALIAGGVGIIAAIKRRR